MANSSLEERPIDKSLRKNGKSLKKIAKNLGRPLIFVNNISK